MTASQDDRSLQEQIAHVKQRLKEARARVPKHDIPAALVSEMDDLEEELERLQAQASESTPVGEPIPMGDDLDAQIARLERRLADARTRVPKHSIPATLVAEIDELDEELERLRSLRTPPEPSS
jgi:DNA repair exonuclease SbcCD ATPase subunit